MVEMTFQVLLLFLAIVGLFLKHYILEQFVRYKIARTGKEFFQVPSAVVSHCACHGFATTIILFPFWGWGSLLIGIIDGLLNFTMKYWRSRQDPAVEGTGLTKMMDNGLESLIYELFYLAMAFLALTTHIRPTG